jgi:2-methylisocitrate lyase-like PEP mutase family enzyme
VTNQREKAELFASLHQNGSPLILVNAWDVASAKIVAAAGSAAVATTSAGVAWSLGTPDGGVLSRELAVGLVERVANAVTVPVTADIESGFGANAQQVAATISAIIAAGAVGVNIEDSLHEGDVPLREITDQSGRLAAAREAADQAGIPLFINARIDTYLRGNGGVEPTVERALAFLEAGASGIFVPGIVDPATVAELVKAIPAPLNVLVGPGSPAIAELAKAGVARVSLGSAVASAAYAVVHRAAIEALSEGTYDSLSDGTSYGNLNALMR